MVFLGNRPCFIKEAIKNGIDTFYIDHAYFDSGYKGEFWNRVSKNRHTYELC